MHRLKLLLCMMGMHDWKLAHPLMMFSSDNSLIAKDCSRCRAREWRPATRVQRGVS
jgi:hypothetical protein